jgi:hypothetical protein
MTDTPHEAAPSSRFSLGGAILSIPVLVILAALILQAVFHSTLAVRHLFAYVDTSYPECAVVERALAVVRGQPLYGDTRHWPYLVAPYGPLTYYPVALIARAAGLRADREDQARVVYLAGRAVSFLAGIAILAWLWAMAGIVGLPRVWRFLPVLFFFSAFRILNFWYSYRPDFPMLALVLWAWAVALTARRSSNVLVSAILMALGAFYKHTAVLSAAALFVWLLADRRRRDALLFASVGAGLVGVQSLLLMLSTGGAWWQNTVGALRSPLYLPGLYTFLLTLSVQEMIPLAGGLAAWLGVGAQDGPTRPARWAFAFTFLAAELMLVRSGGNIYYYLEPYCWGAVLAAACVRAAVARPAGSDAKRGGMPPAWVLLMCLLVVPYANLGLYFLRETPAQCRPLAPFNASSSELFRLLRHTRGEILLSDGFLAFCGASPPTMMDPILLAARADAGGLSPRDLLAKIGRKDFEWVVLSWDTAQPVPQYERLGFLPSDVVRAIAENYRLAAQLGRYYVYEPVR